MKEKNYMYRLNIPDKPAKNLFPALTATGIAILALLVLSAAFITSSHFHFAADMNSGCPICKSADDLLAGSSNSAAFLDPQEIFEKSTIISHLTSVYTVYIDLKKNRAPPAFHSFSNIVL